MEKEELVKLQTELFNKLNISVKDHIEQKNGLNYLSWAWAWQIFKVACPDAIYEIERFIDPNTQQTKPYLFDKDLGYMCFTKVTANGITHEMWLPVMDNANKAMKDKPYSYFVADKEWDKELKRYKVIGQIEKTVDAADMFDINKTIMRCLVKNLAMFGLGIYIYAGEDLPTEQEPLATAEQLARIKDLNVNEDNVKVIYKVKSLNQLTAIEAQQIISKKESANAKT